MDSSGSEGVGGARAKSCRAIIIFLGELILWNAIKSPATKNHFKIEAIIILNVASFSISKPAH